jgi:hypothetical protein
MATITIYAIGYGNAFAGDVEIEVTDPVKSPIPAGHTRVSPHPIPDGHYAMMANGWVYVLGEAPVPPPPNYAADNKAQAEQLLQSTDWVELPSVSNPANTPHLENINEFLAYRTAVRAIAVNPPTTPAVFPAKPDEVWSQ